MLSVDVICGCDGCGFLGLVELRLGLGLSTTVASAFYRLSHLHIRILPVAVKSYSCSIIPGQVVPSLWISRRIL